MPTSKTITVRMYNVGFGDAFLLLLPYPGQRTRKVLVDCGSHRAGPGPAPINDVAKRIIEDVTEEGIARIDVVIATHRHQDHVSGFQNSRIWSQVQVDEVWMPWTEDPDDRDAKRIRDKQSLTALALTEALERTLAARPEMEGALDLARNSLTNEKAMETLHEGFAQPSGGDGTRRRFLSSDDGRIQSPALPGVAIHVLGPSRDPAIIRDMDPPELESYLRLSAAASEQGDAQGSPFADHWAIAPGPSLPAGMTHLALRDVEREWVAKVNVDDEGVIAATLEAAVNGTSLFLVLQIGKATLLLPGDAQWGTWKAVLEDPPRRALVEKTTFYKVGHHGSHNASPVDFVENVLSKRFSAMVSTREMSRWPSIPKAELLDALRRRSKRVVRSDVDDEPDPTGFVRVDDTYVETTLRT